MEKRSSGSTPEREDLRGVEEEVDVVVVGEVVDVADVGDVDEVVVLVPES